MVTVVIEFPPYRFDRSAARLWHGNQPVALRPKAWQLLCYLIERPGTLVTKDELHAALWDAVVSDDTLTHTMGELRQALGDDARTPRIVETVHRRGFRFIARPHTSPVEGNAVGPSVALPPVPEPEIASLVGRDAELARLGTLFAQASAGQRQVVFIEGESGIGKSAIVEAFLHSVRTWAGPVQIGYGQCVEQYSAREPYMPALEVLERLGHGPSGDRLRSVLRSAGP